jgi:hypothetical protein
MFTLLPEYEFFPPSPSWGRKKIAMILLVGYRISARGELATGQLVGKPACNDSCTIICFSFATSQFEIIFAMFSLTSLTSTTLYV